MKGNHSYFFLLLVFIHSKMDVYEDANNSLEILPTKIREYVEEKIQLCQPTNFHVCDGSEEENQRLLNSMEQAGVIRRLKKYKNW